VRRITQSVLIGLIMSAAFAGAAFAQLENENLLVSVPTGYKVDFQQRKGNMLITEMVPTNESVQNWTEMVTVQIFYGLKIAPEQAKSRLEQGWRASCAGSQSKPVAQAATRGYPSITWAMFCPSNGSTGKPENTWFRAIQGADSFYVVQKAFKFMPSKEQESRWLGFLESISVCDSRLAERACPKARQ
jgi:hypothetical protein